MEVSDHTHCPAALPPKKRDPGTHWIGRWLGLRARIEALDKRQSLGLLETEARLAAGQLSLIHT